MASYGFLADRCRLLLVGIAIDHFVLSLDTQALEKKNETPIDRSEKEMRALLMVGTPFGRCGWP